MKVFVLGHRGMLGHVVAAYLEQQGAEVVTSEERYAAEPGNKLIHSAIDSGAEWIINAIGKIKQKTSHPAELLEANALLPVQLKSLLKPGQRLIHASTDCVFSGKAGNYSTTHERDAEDVYGLSKIMGEVVAEPGRCLVIRTSIIGPELKSGAGLMGWFLSQKEPVRGFTNHLWNGITTLEWAKLAFEFIRDEFFPCRPIVQAGCADPVSKFELLTLISHTWHHDLPIQPLDAPEKVDRTLIPDLRRSSIEKQLRELCHWYQSLRRR